MSDSLYRSLPWFHLSLWPTREANQHTQFLPVIQDVDVSPVPGRAAPRRRSTPFPVRQNPTCSCFLHRQSPARLCRPLEVSGIDALLREGNQTTQYPLSRASSSVS